MPTLHELLLPASLPYDDPVARRRAAVLRAILVTGPAVMVPFSLANVALGLPELAVLQWLALAPFALAWRRLHDGWLAHASNLACASCALLVMSMAWVTGGGLGGAAIWLSAVVWIASLTQPPRGAGGWFAAVAVLWLLLTFRPTPPVPAPLGPHLGMVTVLWNVGYVLAVGVIGLCATAIADDLTARSIDAEARASAANADKDAFLATISHELRTPLTSVVGYTELLAEAAMVRGDRSDLDDLDRIRLASRGLLAILDDVLDASQLSSREVTLSPGPVDLGSLVAELRATVEPLARRRRNVLVVELTEPAYVPHLDEGRIRQVLVNLLGNACKFTEDGQIVLRIRPTAAGWLRFEVEDTGIGMTAEQQERVFTRFEQASQATREQYGGWGLGLAICQRLVLAMHGTIELESAIDEGTRYLVDLPDGRGEPAAATALGAA